MPVLIFVLGVIAGWAVAMGGYIVWTTLLGGFDREGTLAMGVAFTIGPALGLVTGIAGAIWAVRRGRREAGPPRSVACSERHSGSSAASWPR